MATSEQGAKLLNAPPARPPGRSVRLYVRLRSALRQLRSTPLALFGTLIVILFLLMAAIGPLIAQYGLEDQSSDLRKPPSAEHVFGTDNLGRDVFSWILVGSRDIISLAGFGTVIAVILGTTVGLLATYEGGWIEEIVMR